jgi:uncharacterized protein (DUF2147 family)
MKTLLLAALTAAVALASGTRGYCSPVGAWLAKDGWTIRIGACGPHLCGFIVKANPPNDPDTNQPWVDKKNADPAKRNRRVVGVQILIAMKPEGPGKWTGRLYNVDDGNTYAGNLIEQDPSTVGIEGCSLGICGGEELTRLAQ